MILPRRFGCPFQQHRKPRVQAKVRKQTKLFYFFAHAQTKVTLAAYNIMSEKISVKKDNLIPGWATFKYVVFIAFIMHITDWQKLSTCNLLKSSKLSLDVICQIVPLLKEQFLRIIKDT